MILRLRHPLIGTKGMLTMAPAFIWNEDIRQTITVKKRENSKTFKHRDQVAAEILYLADCILKGKRAGAFGPRRPD